MNSKNKDYILTVAALDPNDRMEEARFFLRMFLKIFCPFFM